MKTLIVLGTIAVLLGAALYASAQEAVPGIKPESYSLINDISISPYYTAAFKNFNGKAASGVGADVGLGLSKTISVISFIETSDVKHDAFLDRFGGGVQMRGKLGKWLKPYGRFAVGYALDESSGVGKNELFLRPEFGADLAVYRSGNYSISFCGAWALDVGMDRHERDTDRHIAQRIKAGLNITF